MKDVGIFELREPLGSFPQSHLFSAIGTSIISTCLLPKAWLSPSFFPMKPC